MKQQLEALKYYADLEKTAELTDNFRDIGEFHFQMATIVKSSRNKQHNYLILGQGRKDGVQEHAGIITSNGVVGIVDAVSENYSYALSLMNTGVSVSARIGREGGVGPLEWDGKSAGGALLKEIPLQNKFVQGDTVFTSDIRQSSLRYPAGVIATTDCQRGNLRA